MQPYSIVSYDWKATSPTRHYRTGVSLHSHTSHSVETLSFIHALFMDYPILRPVFGYYERVSKERYGIQLDFEAAHWRPPLMPRMAWDTEWKQIRAMGLKPLVSITDHDDIQAPLLLRTMKSSRKLPVSVEWSAPFGPTVFHIGVHNLPPATATEWMERLARYTAAPSATELQAILTDLNANPDILVILNHPLWDLYAIGKDEHNRETNRFLLQHGDLIHALELNGLRHPRENQEVMALARTWQQLVVSGGDRHGMEANANINLTNALTFEAFVQEIRVERRSHVLFLEKYRHPWEQRLLHSTLDAVVDHKSFSQGWQRWDERAFHPDRNGVIRPLSELWPRGKAPLLLRFAIGIVRMARYQTASKAIRLMLPRVDTGVLSAADQEIG